jgi:hypothetical protein
VAARPDGCEQAGGGEDGGGALGPGGGELAGGDPGGFVHVGDWPPGADYGVIAKLRVVQPELELLPPGAASIELPQTWPVVPVAGAAGSGVAAA